MSEIWNIHSVSPLSKSVHDYHTKSIIKLGDFIKIHHEKYPKDIISINMNHVCNMFEKSNIDNNLDQKRSTPFNSFWNKRHPFPFNSSDHISDFKPYWNDNKIVCHTKFETFEKMTLIKSSVVIFAHFTIEDITHTIAYVIYLNRIKNNESQTLLSTQIIE